jgi:hypothetical protein
VPSLRKSCALVKINVDSFAHELTIFLDTFWDIRYTPHMDARYKEALKDAGLVLAFCSLCWLVMPFIGNGEAEKQTLKAQQIEDARVDVINAQRQYDLEDNPDVRDNFSKEDRLNAWRTLIAAEKNLREVSGQ